jgi:capsular polysaccharide biosynthesis protein
MSDNEVAERTKTSMQQMFDIVSELREAQLTVTNVQVLKRDGNRYQGMANVIHDGTTHDVPVDMRVDGSNVFWKTEPGAFMFARSQVESINSPVE